MDDAADRTLETVPVRLVHVETWKRIAVLVERSERWCRTMAERLLTADLDAWLSRQRAAAMRPVQAPAVDEHW